MTLFEALTGGAFDRLNWQHSGEFDQNFSKKSNAPGFARGGGEGGWAVLELTGTLLHVDSHVCGLSPNQGTLSISKVKGVYCMVLNKVLLG